MRGPNLTNDQRHRIGSYLFENFSKGKPVRGSMNILAKKYQVHRRTIYEIWKRGKRQREAGDMFILDSKIKGKKGRPTIELPVERILATSLGDRGSMKTFGAAIGVSAGTIFNWVKQHKIRSHTSALHPALTEENMLNRLHFALSKLSYDKISCSLKFKDMANIIHIDEKWFYITEYQATFFLLMEEDTPYRACKSKSFITKVMFMAAVSRPIYDGNGNLLFYGKIGIFPFTFQAPAQRSSINRPAGTLETKSIPSISKQVTKEMIVNKIIPAIHSKWNEEPAQCLGDVWLSLQACMLEIMNRKGHTDYKVPHLKKNAQRRAGTLPRNLAAEEATVRECITHLHEKGKDGGLEEISEPLGLVHPF